MKRLFFFYSLLVLSSCNTNPVDLRYEFGEVYAEYCKETEDSVYYIAYSDTIINDTIRSLYKEYRCTTYDSLCDIIDDAYMFWMEHDYDYDIAINKGYYIKADSIAETMYNVKYCWNHNVTLLIYHVGECEICKKTHNIGMERKNHIFE